MTNNYRQYPSKGQLPDDQRSVIAFSDDLKRIITCEYFEKKDTWILSDDDGYLANNDEIQWWAEMPKAPPENETSS